MASNYYELRYEDGETSRLDGVTSVEAAKAVAREVQKFPGQSATSVWLVRVTDVDIDAPPQTRRTS